MITLVKTNCCAMGEIVHLAHSPTPVGALTSLYTALKIGSSTTYQDIKYANYWHRYAFVLFSGTIGAEVYYHDKKDNGDYAQNLEDFIKANSLGVVTASEVRKNWTGNMVKVWLWLPDYDKLFPLLEAQGAKLTFVTPPTTPAPPPVPTPTVTTVVQEGFTERFLRGVRTNG